MTPYILNVNKAMFKHLRKAISIAILVAFFSTSVRNPAYAQLAQPELMPRLPMPGVMVHLSPEFSNAQLQGITIHQDNALQFDFLIDKGDKVLEGDQKKEEYKKLIKYFLASLTIPDEDQWVNLSPYEKSRIIKDDFGKTEMGRDLLAEDYLLKQITSSLIYPEDGLGKKFWDTVYQRAWNEYHTTEIPVNTFNKVWIVPDQAIVYESGNSAYILSSHLKVMLEEDYLSLQKHSAITSVTPTVNDTHTIGSQVIREIILPELEKEVNEGKNFANLRQMFSGMILATWYKNALKESLLGKVYADRAKVKGVDQNPQTNELIYQRYLKAFKKGVFNYIREDVDKYTNEEIPRKYFSGGYVPLQGMVKDPAMLGKPVVIAVNYNDVNELPEAVRIRYLNQFNSSSNNGFDFTSASLHATSEKPLGPFTIRGNQRRTSTRNPAMLSVEFINKIISGSMPTENEKDVNSNRKPILLVEDRKDLRDTIEAYIKSSGGFKIDTAADGVEALKMIRENPEKYGAVLTDFEMPNMNGVDLVNELIKVAPNLKVIIHSGVSTLIQQSELPGNVVTVLQKPASVFASVKILNYLAQNGQFNEAMTVRELDAKINKFKSALTGYPVADTKSINDFIDFLNTPQLLDLTQFPTKIFINILEKQKNETTHYATDQWDLVLKRLRSVVSIATPQINTEYNKVPVIQLIVFQKWLAQPLHFNKPIDINETILKNETGLNWDIKTIENVVNEYKTPKGKTPIKEELHLIFNDNSTITVHIFNPAMTANTKSPLMSTLGKLGLTAAAVIAGGTMLWYKSQIRENMNVNKIPAIKPGLITSFTNKSLHRQFLVSGPKVVVVITKGKERITAEMVTANNFINSARILIKTYPGSTFNLIYDLNGKDVAAKLAVLLLQAKQNVTDHPILISVPDPGYHVIINENESDQITLLILRKDINPFSLDTMVNVKHLELLRYSPEAHTYVLMPAESNKKILTQEQAQNVLGTKGGIDFNAANLNLQIKRDGRGVPLPLSQQDMGQLMQIQGFVPEIIEIKPAVNVPIITELQQKLQTTSA